MLNTNTFVRHIGNRALTLKDIMNDVDLCVWVADAKPGDRLVYYRGHLSHDRMASVKVLDDGRRRRLADVANRVLVAEAQGLVMPVQRRVARNEWLYLAIRRQGSLRSPHHPKPTHSLSRSMHHA